MSTRDEIFSFLACCFVVFLIAAAFVTISVLIPGITQGGP